MASKLMRYVGAGMVVIASFGAGYRLADTRRRVEIENLTHDVQMREYLFREAEAEAIRVKNRFLPIRFVEAKTSLPKQEILRRIEEYNRNNPEFSLSPLFYGNLLDGFYAIPKAPGVGYPQGKIERDVRELSR